MSGNEYQDHQRTSRCDEAGCKPGGWIDTGDTIKRFCVNCGKVVATATRTDPEEEE